MKNFEFEEHPLSGARLTVPFSLLGAIGPKHHAVVIGFNQADDLLWVAELSRKFGYRLVSAKEWFADNQKYLGGLKIAQNPGPRTNLQVAQSAVDEVLAKSARKTDYNVVLNNCESFAERHTNGKRELSPQVRSAFKAAGIVIAAGAIVLGNRTNSKG